MKSWLIILTILVSPHLVFAVTGTKTPSELHKTKHKKSKHHKKSRKPKKISQQRSSTKSRYKLVAFRKDGKLRHRYVDTKPEKVDSSDNLYPEATPSLPVLESEFIPNHSTPERMPSAVKEESISFDDSKDSIPPPHIE